jgi:hypothetical protein
MSVYGVNIVFSSIVINNYSLGNQTLIIFLTNLLFMITKLSNVYNIINTEKNIFFSAYLNTKVQFNDIDPHEIEKIKKQKSIDEFILDVTESQSFNYNSNCTLSNKNKKKFQLLEGGGFVILDSSDSD